MQIEVPTVLCLRAKAALALLEQTQHHLLFGDDSFVRQLSNKSEALDLREHSEAQRQALTKPLATLMKQNGNRDTDEFAAYKSAAYTTHAIAEHMARIKLP